jgi:hypothetical protein
MSRSGYCDGTDDNWQLIMWRGQVASSIRGKRGQAMLREMLVALDGLPKKELIAESLQSGAGVCAFGALGLAREIDMVSMDPDDTLTVAKAFGVAEPLVREIVYENDEGTWRKETPRGRYERMRSWVVGNITGDHPKLA